MITTSKQIVDNNTLQAYLMYEATKGITRSELCKHIRCMYNVTPEWKDREILVLMYATTDDKISSEIKEVIAYRREELRSNERTSGINSKTISRENYEKAGVPWEHKWSEL